jgi:hypothetical protein
VKILHCLAWLAAVVSLNCHAQNEIRMLAPVAKAAAIWVDAAPRISAWADTNDPLICSTWNPGVATIDEGVAFTQTSLDCLQNQERSIQARQQDKISLAFRNVGAPVVEPRTITVSSTRTATGTHKIANWVAAPPLYSTWTATADPLVCTTWTPSTATVGQGISFQQTSNDCQQTEQSRVQAREQDTISLAYRNKGTAYIETRTVTVSSTRTAIGTSLVDQGDYMIGVGICCSGQYGYIPATTGSLVSASNPAYTLSYLVVKYDGTIYFTFSQVKAAQAPAFVARIKTVSIDFLDSNQNLISTATANPPKVQFSNFMGWNISGALLTQALGSRYMRLHIVLN